MTSDAPALLLIAFVASFFSAIAGGGAGLLQFPALILLGLGFASAVATQKAAVVALGVGSMARHLREPGIEWRFLVTSTLLGLPGVVFGTRLALLIPDRAGELGFGILNIALGLYSIFRPQLGLVDQSRHRQGPGLWIGYGLVFAVGWLTGLVPSGPGVFSTLLFLTWFGLDYRRAVTYTMLMVGLCWNLTGAITVGLYGSIAWSWMPALLVGGVLGGYLGSHVALLKGNRFVKRAYEALTLLMGASLIAQGLLRPA